MATSACHASRPPTADALRTAVSVVVAVLAVVTSIHGRLRSILSSSTAVARGCVSIAGGTAPVATRLTLDCQRVAFRSPDIACICEFIPLNAQTADLGSPGIPPSLHGVGITVEGHGAEYGRGPLVSRCRYPAQR